MSRNYPPRAALAATVLLAACGGGGGEAAAPLVKPARYSADSYAPFATQHGIDNLEGTWLVLVEGVLSRGETPIVSGSNYREDYTYWSRSTLRLRQNPNGGYYSFTCGPGGARDSALSYYTEASLYIPFYYYSTTEWMEFPMAIVDAATIQRSDVTKEWGWVGRNGEAMSWDLSWTLKRISDDPLAAVGWITDHANATEVEAGCLYEAEGSYVASEDDDYVQNFHRSGRFFEGAGYPGSPVASDGASYWAEFNLKQLDGYRTTHWKVDHFFSTSDGDTVDAAQDAADTASSYSVEAAKAADPFDTDDATLFFDL